MPDAPKLQRMAQEVEVYLRTGEDAEAYLQSFIHDKLTPCFYNTLISGSPDYDGWMLTDFGGRYGNHYEWRAGQLRWHLSQRV